MGGCPKGEMNTMDGAGITHLQRDTIWHRRWFFFGCEQVHVKGADSTLGI